MNDLEDRLRDAYAEAARTVSKDNIRQLNEQSVVITWPQGKTTRPARRWAIPLAAAAVLAVIVAAVLPSLLPKKNGDSTGGLRPPSDKFVGALTPQVGGIVIITSSGGRQVGTVAPYPHQMLQTAATGDGVHYVVAAGEIGVCGSSLFQFRLNAAGQPSALTPFHGGTRLGRTVTQLAISADGTTLAYLGRPCGHGSKTSGQQLFVVNLKTGRGKEWSVPGQSAISKLSLTENGSELAFDATNISNAPSGIYLLNTSSAPGPIDQVIGIGVEQLVTASVGYTVTQPMISLNGRIAYFEISRGKGLRSSDYIRAINTSTRKNWLISKTNGLGHFLIASDPSVRRAIGIVRPAGARPTFLKVNFKARRTTLGGTPTPFYIPDNGGYYIW